MSETDSSKEVRASRKVVKITRYLASDQVCDEIRNRIKDGYWKVGERVPSESELANAFGVNRLTVRMALRKLNSQGILETRVGEGSYVKDFNFQEYVNEVSDLYVRPELLDDVCDFRKLIEVECSHVAMERATPGELAKLEVLSDRYEGLFELLDKPDFSQESLSLFVDADLDFHYCLCTLSHNMLYVYSYSLASEAIRQYLNVIIRKRFNSRGKKSPLQLDHEKQMHRLIYEAIKNKDFPACKKLLEDMIDRDADI